LGTKYLVVLCAGSTLPLAKQTLNEAPYKLSGAVAKLAGITFGRLPPSYWIDYLGFITEGKLATIFTKPSLGVSNWLVIFTSSTNANKFSGTNITTPSMWCKEQKWQPTNGQENCEIIALPMDNGQRQVKIT
jgi:hypothetical protein